MYKKVTTDMSFTGRELETIEFWKENDIFKKSTEQREGGKEFSFYDGPPTANGKPHVGHIITRVIKDIIPRFKVMKGYHVLRKAGWDTHGLPVELEVEKTLGMDGKQDIEKYGVEPFIKKCKESVWKYQAEWEKMTDRLAYWVDMEHPYITYEDNYIESVWWSLKQIFDKGLIYKGHKIVPYCPRCGTALSSHEVAQGYKDVEETSIIVKFRLEDRPDTSILAWTTTPWTLPSNVAVCVHPDYEYVEIETEEGKFILAAALADKYFENYKKVKSYTGKQLEGMKYVPLFDWYKKEKGKDCWYVTCDTYVTLSDGTGVVHIAPAFGEDDAKVGRAYGLPFVQLVDERGRFVEGTGEVEGVFVKDADKTLIKDLAVRGLLFKKIKFTHSYPFCWRCDTPLLYYARSTWFIKMSELRESLLKNNDSVNWYPESIKKGRMGNFLENVIDWGLSRERYWGTPLPLWVCEDCGNIRAIGSKAELIKEGALSGDIELHKPYVDGVTIKCSCGKTMHRTPEVIDCWYDSGAMPFAQYHYPFENKDLFEKTFPADFISEAIDQTRGWFYTLLAISTLLFDKSPFKNCIVLGHVNDKNGVKMSKHKGNVIDPWTVLNNQGADAVRWYFYTSSAPWLPSRFYEEAVSEAQRKFLGTLWNTCSFYVLYAEIDSFDPTKYDLKDCKLTLMDKWVLSELNTLVEFVDTCLEDYKITESARAISDFTDLLSNWYVRRCRERYWAGEMGEDKVAAYMTLYTVLETLVRLAAPYVPFMTESIYQNIVRSVNPAAPESVHLCDFPVADKKYIDKKMADSMNRTIDAATLGRSARAKAAVKNRQPLGLMYLVGFDEIPDSLKDVLKDELNVKEILLAKDAEKFVSYEVKPQLKTVGPKYGALVGAIRNHLAENGAAAAQAAAADSVYTFEVNGQKVELAKDDMLISTVSVGGFVAESDKGMTVILDASLTPELVSEGNARELISKIQTMRKDSGFEVTDVIAAKVCGEGMDEVLKAFGERIKKDVLAVSLELSDKTADMKEWDINGAAVYISVVKSKR